MSTMKFGRFDIQAINFGSFRLDGGSMFGSVPKNLWSKKIVPDEENCIPLATRCLLISDSDRTFLVDVGMGEKWSEKSRQIFAIKNTPVDQLGFDPESVTDIILTHLHFDHAGGISRYVAGSTSEVELCYPKARVFLQEANWKNARSPTLKERASYLKENVDVLHDAKLELVRGSVEIYPDLWVHQVNGHTEGQQWIEIRSPEGAICYATDLIPTSHHVPVAYHMGYDICAGTILQEKDEFLASIVERGSILAFEHDPLVAAVKVKRDERGQYAVDKVIEI